MSMAMRTHYLVLAILLGWLLPAAAQNTCRHFERLMTQATADWSRGEFEQALNQLAAAREHCPDRSAEIDAQLVAFTSEIARKYAEASEERDRADRERAAALAASLRAQELSRDALATEYIGKARNELVNGNRALALTLLDFTARFIDSLHPAVQQLAVELYYRPKLRPTDDSSLDEGLPATTATCLAWSPDGTQLAVGFSNGYILRYRMSDDASQPPVVFVQIESTVENLAWSPDGTQLAAGGKTAVWVWEADNGLLQTRFVVTPSVWSLAWSPDSQYLAAGCDDMLVRIWHVPEQRFERQLAGHLSLVRDVAWSPDGHRLLSGGDDNLAIIHQVFPAGDSLVLAGHTDWVRNVAWSPDGEEVLTLSDDTEAIIWHATTGQLARRLTGGHSHYILSGDWSADSGLIASGDSEGVVQLWNSQDATLFRTLDNLNSPVRTLQWSPNGGILAGMGERSPLTMWLTDGRKLTSYPVPTDFTALESPHSLEESEGPEEIVFSLVLNAVSWHPNGRYLGVGTAEGQVQCFDLNAPAAPTQVLTYGYAVNDLAWSPSGEMLATAVADLQVQVLLWPGLQAIATLNIPADPLALAWAPDNTRLAVAGADGWVYVWDLATETLLHSYQTHQNAVRGLAWSPDGSRLVSSSDDYRIAIYNLALEQVQRVISFHTDFVRDVHWSANGRYFITTSDDRKTVIWKAETGEVFKELNGGHQGWIFAVDWAESTRQIVTGDNEGVLCFWDERSGQLISTQRTTGTMIKDVAWSPDQRQVAVATDGHTVTLWTSAGPTPQRLHLQPPANLLQPVAPVIPGDGPPPLTRDYPLMTPDFVDIGVNDLAWSPNENLLAAGMEDGSLRIFNRLSPDSTTLIKTRQESVAGVNWSPDGQYVATAGRNQTVKIWQWPSRSLVATLRHEGQVTHLAWSPDGQRLAVACADQHTYLWDWPNRRLLSRLAGHTGWVRRVAWSPNGENLATASDDTNTRIWNGRSGEAKSVLRGHTDYVRDLRWLNNDTLATVSDDGRALLWRGAAGAKPTAFDTLATNQGYLMGVAWHADSNRLATGSDNGALFVWMPGPTDSTLAFSTPLSRISKLAWAPKTQILAIAGNGMGPLAVKLQSANLILEQSWFSYSLKTAGVARDTLLDLVVNNYAGEAQGFYWSPNQRYLALIANDTREGLVYDLSQPGNVPVAVLNDHVDWIRAMAWTPDSRHLYTVSDDQQVMHWDLNDPEQAQRQWRAHTGWIYSTALSKNGRWLATGGDDQMVKVWDVANEDSLYRSWGPTDASFETGSILQLEWSPDNQLLSAHTISNQLLVWDVATNRELLRQSGVGQAAWSPTNDLLAMTSENTPIKFWSASIQDFLPGLIGDNRPAQLVAWSPDGQRLAVTYNQNGPVLKVWDMLTWRQLVVNDQFSKDIVSLEWNPAGNQLATVTSEGNVQVWGARQTELILDLTPELTHVGESAVRVRWSPDGRYLLTFSNGGNVRFWRLSPAVLLQNLLQQEEKQPLSQELMQAYNLGRGPELNPAMTPADLSNEVEEVVLWANFIRQKAENSSLLQEKYDRYNRAIALYQHAINNENDESYVLDLAILYANYGWELLLNKDYSNAVAYLNQARKLAPDDQNVLRYDAYIQWATGHTREAITDFVALLWKQEIDPDLLGFVANLQKYGFQLPELTRFFRLIQFGRITPDLVREYNLQPPPYSASLENLLGGLPEADRRYYLIMLYPKRVEMALEMLDVDLALTHYQEGIKLLGPLQTRLPEGEKIRIQSLYFAALEEIFNARNQENAQEFQAFSQQYLNLLDQTTRLVAPTQSTLELSARSAYGLANAHYSFQQFPEAVRAAQLTVTYCEDLCRQTNQAPVYIQSYLAPALASLVDYQLKAGQAPEALVSAQRLASLNTTSNPENADWVVRALLANGKLDEAKIHIFAHFSPEIDPTNYREYTRNYVSEQAMVSFETDLQYVKDRYQALRTLTDERREIANQVAPLFEGAQYAEVVALNQQLIDYSQRILLLQDSLLALGLVLPHTSSTNWPQRLAWDVGNQSYYQLFTRQYGQAVAAAQHALTLGAGHWVKTNLAHAMLLRGNTAEAREVYLEIKDLPDDSSGEPNPATPLREVLLADLRILRAADIWNNDFPKIAELLLGRQLSTIEKLRYGQPK